MKYRALATAVLVLIVLALLLRKARVTGRTVQSFGGEGDPDPEGTLAQAMASELKLDGTRRR